MKKSIFIISTLFVVTILSAQDQTAADIWAGDRSSAVNVELNPNQPLLPMASGVVLYDNGPLVNSPGTGAGGADESVLQNTSLGMAVYGWAFQFSNPYWVADDFTVPAGIGWDVSKFVFYGYQTGSTTTSTITGIHFIIYDGVPGQSGTNVVWGDSTTNRLTSTTWSNIYRVLETTSGNTDRPIMENTCDVSFHLNPGTYWVAFETDGTLGSGPWAPPVTITGQSTTGNALQSPDNLVSWSNVVDGGQQGFPFVIHGSPSIPLSNWPIILGIFLISAFLVIRYRRRRLA